MYMITKRTAEITDSGFDEAIVPTKEQAEQMLFYFRLLDDDDIIYFEGISSTFDDDEAFDPLDDYENDYTVTCIEYFDAELDEWFPL